MIIITLEVSFSSINVNAINFKSVLLRAAKVPLFFAKSTTKRQFK